MKRLRKRKVQSTNRKRSDYTQSEVDVCGYGEMFACIFYVLAVILLAVHLKKGSLRNGMLYVLAWVACLREWRATWVACLRGWGGWRACVGGVIAC